MIEVLVSVLVGLVTFGGYTSASYKKVKNPLINDDVLGRLALGITCGGTWGIGTYLFIMFIKYLFGGV